jgi:hypothetical protein
MTTADRQTHKGLAYSLVQVDFHITQHATRIPEQSGRFSQSELRTA